MLQVKTTIMEVSSKVSSLSRDVACLKSADGTGGGAGGAEGGAERGAEGGTAVLVHESVSPTLSWSLGKMFSRSPPANLNDGVQNSKPWSKSSYLEPAQDHARVVDEMQTVVRNFALDLACRHGEHKHV